MLDKVQKFNTVLNSFKIKANCVDYQENDHYSFYDVELLPRTKIKDFENFSQELGLSLKINGKPTISVLPELGIVRLEFIKNKISKLNLFDIMSNNNPSKDGLQCVLGKSTSGEDTWFDLAQCPHLLVAGTTGSGKSTVIHNIIANLLYYHKTKLYLIDPKNIEFCTYAENIKKDLKVCYEYNQALFMLDKLCEIMDLRLSLIRNKNSVESFPYIVLIIDEFADLILQDVGNQFYNKLCKLAQKCRAARIHIILSTQRPSVDIVNGAIKANFPARIACKTSSKIDSKVILDSIGAEHLLGKGDAFIKLSNEMTRLQIAYTNSEEICKRLK